MKRALPDYTRVHPDRSPSARFYHAAQITFKIPLTFKSFDILKMLKVFKK